jgi:hypothetical protein
MRKTIFAATAVFFLGAITASVYAKDKDPQVPKVPVLDYKCLVDVVQSGSMDYNAAKEWCTYYVVPGDAKTGTVKGQTKG